MCVYNSSELHHATLTSSSCCFYAGVFQFHRFSWCLRSTWFRFDAELLRFFSATDEIPDCSTAACRFATDEISDPECGKAQLSRRPGNMKNGRIGRNIESAGSPCFSCVQTAK